MRFEDALRKIRLLRRLVPENGASEAEAETAACLVRTLMERYSIGREDLGPVVSPSSRMTWVYWEQLLAEFGINLNRFGGRASASLGTDALILIQLATGQWQMQQTSATGWKIIVRDFGLESLRAHLAKYGHLTYSLAG
jgi:Protein of unknown function (DUF2786)